MNFAVRLSAPVDRLAARLRAALRARGGAPDERAMVASLPATSNLRDPALLAALSRFEEPPADAA